MTRRISRRAFVSGGALSALAAFGVEPLATTLVRTAKGDEVKLHAFHRAEQLQAHIPRQGLAPLPGYLTQSSRGFLFDRVRPDRKPIPFVDSFTITRFLGGVRDDWLRQFNEFDSSLGRRSLDYVVRDSGNRLKARPEVLRMHLEPYLAAGYSPSDITIVLDNIPWALARDGGSTGSYGQRNPPADIEDWKWLLESLARDLKAVTANASPNFKVGNEFDTKKSFNGSSADYLALYRTSFNVLRKEFPNASIAPGEFTGNGHCSITPQCVYDTAEFLRQTKSLGIQPDYIPRSLHAFQDKGNTLPSTIVARAVESFAALGSTVAEIHQFGLLGQPFGSFDLFGSDQGSRRASWEFCVLMGLYERLKPRRVFHWDCFFTLNGTNFSLLNGVGFTRLLLDQLVGATVRKIPSTSQYGDNVETVTAMFQLGRTVTLVIAVFSPTDRRPGTIAMTLPMSKSVNWKWARTGVETNVFATIRSDLLKANNLRQEFVRYQTCTAEPTLMAVDRSRARQMLLANRTKYETAAQAELAWKALNDAPYPIEQRGATLKLDIPANEVLVLQTEL